jgi:ribosomal protein S14
MKLKNKLLKDISIRLKFNNIESRKRSLKILIRLKLINYLTILHNLSKLSASSKEKNRCFITSRSSGNLTKISLSRIKLRELMSGGLVIGFSKASW